MAHFKLASKRVVNVLNFLADHSRLLIQSKVDPTVTGQIVVKELRIDISKFGPTQTKLTENAMVFTTPNREADVPLNTRYIRMVSGR